MAEVTTLSGARCGDRLRIVSMCPNCPDCTRLRDLGFCESNEVCKLAESGPMICQIMGARVAIGKSLGRFVYVEKMA